jgi:phage terminase small subunit
MAKDRVTSPRVKRFVWEYVWGEHAGNGAHCALAAGFGKKLGMARRYAWQILRKPNVKALVEAQAAEKESLLKQKAVRTAEETYRLATVDPKDLIGKDGNLLPLHKMPADARRAIASIEVEEVWEGHGEDREQTGLLHKVKLHDKRAAQELFLKYAGKLKDKVELEAGATLEQLVLAADKLARERQAQSK